MKGLLSLSSANWRSAGLLAAAAAAGLSALWLAAQPPGQKPDEDYLSPELRVRVERLKVEISQPTDSPEALRERVETLWQWANAFALEGGQVPPNLPLVVSLGFAQARGASAPVPVLSQLPAMVRELQIKEESPEAIGKVTISPKGPFVSSSYATIEQTYTLGEMAMAEGGGLFIGKEFAADHGAFQSNDPEGENYVSVRSSSPAARFTPIPARIFGSHGHLVALAPILAFRLEGTTLEKGETVTATYGDRSGGSRGFRIHNTQNEDGLLPLYVDLEGRGFYFSPQWPTFQIVGGEVDSVRGFVPSVVEVGEPFELAVRSEDRFGNRATSTIPAYDILLNGEKLTEIPGGDEGLSVLRDLRIDEPGIYRFRLVSQDGTLEGTSNPLWVQEDPPYRIYWGDTHGHTGYAEGVGKPAGYFRYGRDDARLDFLTLSEHDVFLDDREWEDMREATRKFTNEGQYIALLGYEWSAGIATGGHHNVLFRTVENRDRVPVQLTPGLWDLYLGLHRANRPEDVIVIPHAHTPGDWRISDPQIQPLVEMVSKHGTFEWFGNYYLRNGAQIGFIGASDDHNGRPGHARGNPGITAQRNGLAAVLAPEKTTDALFAAMRQISAYATSGPRILLGVTLNDSIMGKRIPFSEERTLRCRVSGTSPIDTIDVVKNGNVIYRRSYATTPLTSAARVQVSFASASEPFVRDAPRGHRTWAGSLEVRGARLVSLQAPGFDNPYHDRASIDPSNPNRVLFNDLTRGGADTLLLELEGTSTATELRFQISEATELGRTLPVLRAQNKRFPSAQITLSLGDLNEGRLRHEISQGRDVDAIALQVFDPGAPLDRELEFTDLGEPEQGDYYYVRVTQLDGEQAWSSPWWVGGVAPR